MARYMLAVHSREGEVREPITEEAMRASHARLGQVEREMAAAGAWVFSGRLHEPDTATVVRVSGGEPPRPSVGFVGLATEARTHCVLVEWPDLAGGRRDRCVACRP